jgi:hypothetical protein
MSVQKKSLIGNRTAVKKAIIASKPDTTVGEPMKAQQLSLKAKASRSVLHLKAPKGAGAIQRLSLKAAKGGSAVTQFSFKAAKKI